MLGRRFKESVVGKMSGFLDTSRFVVMGCTHASVLGAGAGLDPRGSLYACTLPCFAVTVVS